MIRKIHLILFVLFAPLALMSQITEAEIYLDTAIYYFEKGDYEAAIYESTSAIICAPDFSDAYCLRAASFIKTEEYKRAKKDYTVIIALDSSSYIGLYGRAEANYYLENYEDALFDVSILIDFHPDSSEAHLLNAEMYYNLDYYWDADSIFKTALSLEKSAYLYYCLGITADSRGEVLEASEYFIKAIDMQPNYSAALFALANNKWDMMDNDSAILLFSQVIEIDSMDIDSYYNRALLYGEKQDYQLAIADYTKAIELDPKFTDAYFNRALAYQNSGQKEKCCKDMLFAAGLNDKEAKQFYKNNCY